MSVPKRERGDTDDATVILGLKKRTIQAMALRGELPGAAKLSNRWTYDLEELRSYVRDEVKSNGQKAAEGTKWLFLARWHALRSDSHQGRRSGAKQARTA